MEFQNSCTWRKSASQFTKNNSFWGKQLTKSNTFRMIGKRATCRRRSKSVLVAIVMAPAAMCQSLIDHRWWLRKSGLHWRNSHKNTRMMTVCQATDWRPPPRAIRPHQGPWSPWAPSWPTLTSHCRFLRLLPLLPLLRCCAFLDQVLHRNCSMNKGTCISVPLWLFEEHEGPSNFCANWRRPLHFWMK